MNTLDMVIVVVLCFCLIRGIFRGLIKEVASIIGVLGGFYAAYTYYPRLAKIMSSWISNTGYLNILSFMIIFCVVLIIISILGIIIKYLLNIAFLGWVDRICGAGFSLLKGVLIVSVVLLILTAFLPQGAALVKQSLLAPHVVVVSEKMAKVVSKDMKHAFTDNLKELKKAWTSPKK